MTQPRTDLLGVVARYDRRARRRVARIERWRRRSISAGAVVRRSRVLADEMHDRGLGPGDRIGILLHDGPLWQVAFLAVLRVGGIAVPLDVSLDEELIRRQAEELELSAWCTEEEAPRPRLSAKRFELSWRHGAVAGGTSGRPRRSGGPPSGTAPAPQDDPDRIAEIVLTSGTSGAPTAVPIRHRNLRAVVDGLAAEIEPYRRALRLAPALHLGVALPLSHLYGQMMGFFVPVLLDAHVSSLATLAAHEFARGLREAGVHVLATVPRTLDRLAEHLRSVGEERWGPGQTERRLEEFRDRHWLVRRIAFEPLRRRLGRRLIAVISGGAPLDPDTEDFFRTLGHVVIQGYGLTETAPLVTLEHPFDARRRSLGRPLPGVEVRLAEDGEILVRGDNVAASRLGGAAVDDAGWLHTGDLGRFGDDGRLRFEGRKGERIVTPAGVNVDPEPVAARLRRRPGIRDAVAMDRPWGEKGVVCAVLLPGPGASPEDAVAEVNRELPDAARIRAWRLWPGTDFPRTRTGKPRRAEIRRWLEERAPDAAGERAGRAPEKPAVSPTDPCETVARAVAEVADADAADLGPDTRIGDVTTSLDRVELAAVLEGDFGLALLGSAFGGDPTLGEIAESLRPARAGDEEGRRIAAGAAGEGGVGDARGGDEGSAEVPVSAPGDGDSAAARGGFEARGRRLLATTGEVTDVPAARWRSLAPVRALRILLREGLIHPLWFLLCDLDVAGRVHAESLAPPFLVAANHLSILDPAAVLFGLDRRRRSRIAPTAMWEYFLRASTGRIQYGLGVLALDLIPLVQTGDWRPTLRIAGRLADRGGCPLVFPEGERTLTGDLLDFRLGIGVMARELHLPILPCGIRGLLPVLPRGARWPRSCWQHRAPVIVRFGEALPAPRPGDDVAAVVAELRRRIRGLLVADEGGDGVGARHD